MSKLYLIMTKSLNYEIKKTFKFNFKKCVTHEESQSYDIK